MFTCSWRYLLRIISKCLSGTGAELALGDTAVMEAGKATVFSGSLEIMKYMFVGVPEDEKGGAEASVGAALLGCTWGVLKEGILFYWDITYIP